jgi:hypothetical protein
MLIKIGYDIALRFPNPTSVIHLLHVHPSRRSDLIASEHFYPRSLPTNKGGIVRPQGKPSALGDRHDYCGICTNGMFVLCYIGVKRRRSLLRQLQRILDPISDRATFTDLCRRPLSKYDYATSARFVHDDHRHYRRRINRAPPLFVGGEVANP